MSLHFTVRKNDYQSTPIILNRNEVVSVEPVYNPGYVAIRMTDGRTIESKDSIEKITELLCTANSGPH